MSFPIESLPDIPADMIASVKDFVRIDHDLDDEAVREFICAAASLCENFIGQMVFTRQVQEMLPLRIEWQKLKHIPVQSINAVEFITSDGTAIVLEAGEYSLDIDGDGFGWIRLQNAHNVSRMRAVYDAGLATSWSEIPPNLMQGIIRMAGYFYAHRDGVDGGGPPNAVTALWRPHRRLRIG